VAALPITTWNFKAEPGVKHLGPVAQDFRAAFAVGMDDKHIATVDAEGVALAAIQGLNQALEEQRAENAELKRRLDALEKLVLNQKVK
jgi:trimeric autotransporter adhesin